MPRPLESDSSTVTSSFVTSRSNYESTTTTRWHTTVGEDLITNSHEQEQASGSTPAKVTCIFPFFSFVGLTLIKQNKKLAKLKRTKIEGCHAC
ncbi:hypothetical protein PR202_ga31031 [Eleusine coracana subsp. coracana]|uniref:Uncharacterized protein n=1 Tax=Eleusine coracana subsp. coracana TaxID=191504 RepID=A0AAV5DQJ1_ELECO|nr:hypothetical protein PR202_ga31031 [Eleusine coracana subsp. coracana]